MGWEIKGEGVIKVFVMFVFVMFEWKNGYLYTNGAVYHGISWEDSVYVVAVVWEENVLSLPGWRKKKKDLPPGGQCATVKSSLQSIHIAEVHFDFIKIRYN